MGNDNNLKETSCLVVFSTFFPQNERNYKSSTAKAQKH